jgi:hydroxymethylpyrimidine pyrophosphatase-like HAD family hydrolase
MGGFVQAVATDLDGTLAEGTLPAAAQAAIREARDGGLAVVLVTGRIAAELEADFGRLADEFDAVVTENGAVLLIGGVTRELARPVEVVLSDRLAEQGVAVRRGRVLLACDAFDADVVHRTVEDLGLDCQLLRNRSALMVLPAGVSKGTGLAAALAELGISPHNAIAVGDAENDLALLEAAEVGVAVANAVPSLREHADLVLGDPDGQGVAALLAGPLVSGEVLIRPARHRIAIGAFADNSPTTVPGAQANLLVCGPTGAGKSHLAGLLVEQWVLHGYTVLVLDMEGDHIGLDRLHDTVVLGEHGLPTVTELLSVVRQQAISVVVDMSAISEPAKIDYLRTLAGAIDETRAATGLPHWILVDEAHVALSEGGTTADVFRPQDRGYCLVTYRPDQLTPAALAAVDYTLTVTGPDRGTGGEYTRGPMTATLRELGGLEQSFVVANRRTPHRRHWHKYAAFALPSHRWFYFRHPDEGPAGTAANVEEFARQLAEADPKVVEFHLLRGDFSRWFGSTIRDRHLTDLAAAVERDLHKHRARDIEHARDRLVDHIETNYRLDDKRPFADRP